MAAHISLYFAENEEMVSRDGDMSNPVQINLRSDQEEENEVRLYLEAEDGYQVLETEVEADGSTSDLWSFAPDNDGIPGSYEEWGQELNLGTVGSGTAERTYLWAKAKTESNEKPRCDKSVTLMVDGVVEPL